MACCGGDVPAIWLCSRARYRSACLMLKSMESRAVCGGTTSCSWDGCACDEDGRVSCSCWVGTVLPAMRARILRRASMSCAEAPSPSRLTSNIPEAVCSTSGALGPAPVPAEGWMAEADGLAGSGASGGVDA
jgi:hypothetical protein